jgi:hypothetical protein
MRRLHPRLGWNTPHVEARAALLREAYMRRVLDPGPNRQLVLASANTATAPKHREPLAAIVTSNRKSHVTSLLLDYSLDGRAAFLNEVAYSDFVACPRGNGLDTHRLWEAIYLGSIPIVFRRHIPVKGIDIKLPMLVIDDWKCIIDETFLRSSLDRIRSKKYDYSLVSLDYWVNEILSSSTLKNP